VSSFLTAHQNIRAEDRWQSISHQSARIERPKPQEGLWLWQLNTPHLGDIRAEDRSQSISHQSARIHRPKPQEGLCEWTNLMTLSRTRSGLL